jgi:hypothetical protein
MMQKRSGTPFTLASDFSVQGSGKQRARFVMELSTAERP